MAANATTATVFRFSPTKPPQFSNRVLCSYRCSPSSIVITQRQISCIGISPMRSVSSPESAVVGEDEEEGKSASLDDEVALDAAGDALPPRSGCKACGREQIESGCNGEGRIQGGIATVPGFGWWPIKAYRPCPAYVASGGRYRRTGQSMDDVVSGRSREASDGTTNGAKSRKKKNVAKKFKG